MMKKAQLIATVIGLFIFTASIKSSFAVPIQIQTNTTFTCSTNAECKRKCKEHGGTWKPNPGGSTLGTCTVKNQSLADGDKVKPPLPSKAELDSLSVVAQNSQAILKELNALLSKSYIVKELGIEGAQINSTSIVFNKGKKIKRACATCLGDGFAVEMCCKWTNPFCQLPCQDGTPLVFEINAR